MWLVERELKPSTYGDYDSALNVHLLPAFGDLPLGEITRRRIKALTARLRAKGLRAKTVRKIVNVLSVILSEAFEDELITAHHPTEETQFSVRTKGPITSRIIGPIQVAGGGFEPPTFGL